MSIDELCNVVNKWFCRIGGVAIVLMIGLACINILLRPFGYSWKGAYEIVGFFGAIVFAFSLGYTQISDGHVSVDIMSPVYSTRIKKSIKAFSLSISLVFFGVLTWRLFAYAKFIIMAGEKSDTLRIPFYPFIFGVAIGFLFLVFAILKNLLSLMISRKEEF